MIFLFSLIYSFSLYSKDIGVLLIASTDTLSTICEFAKQKNIKLSFSYVGNKANVCSDYDLEYVQYIRFPVGIYANNGKEKIFSRFSNIVITQDLFDCIYSLYPSTSTLGLFVQGAFFPPSLWDFIPSSVSWVSGGVIEENEVAVSYEYKGKKIIFFELLKSTSQLLTSSSSLFIVDEKMFNENILNIFNDLVVDNINFLKISDIISSIRSTTTLPSFSPYLNNFNETEVNFLSYLNMISRDVFMHQDKTIIKQGVMSLCDLISLYPPDLNLIYDFYEKARDISLEIYSLMSMEAPLFVYEDFLSENVMAFSVEKTTRSLKYICDEAVFNVNINGDAVIFSIELSTSEIFDEIHIYADINKRSGQGNQTVIFRNEKIDSASAWEYAFLIKNKTAKFYTSTSRDYKLIKEFPILIKDRLITFSVPLNNLTGYPISWRYLVGVVKGENIYGFVRRISPKIITTPYD